MNHKRELWRKYVQAVWLVFLLSEPFAAVAQERVGVATAPPGSAPTGVVSHAVSSAPQTTPTADVLIGQGDLLQVSLYGVQDFNLRVRVDSNNEISLPLIETVRVAGLTTVQAEKLIEKELKAKGLYNNPQVSVVQQEFGDRNISVMGEVQKPGVYPVMVAHRLFDMLSAAGGTTPKAGRDILITHRNDPSRVQKETFSSDASKQMDSNVVVFPGDTIVVTKAPIVYVVGDVRLPGGFILDKSSGLTILQALALAQGTTSTAALNRSKLIHTTPNGPKETPIYLKSILAGKAQDLTLEADDILFIPKSAAKATMQGMSAALQTAAGAAVYRF